INPETGDDLALAPRTTVLTAGAGNDALRQMLGLERSLGQRRPLHMVMVRGDLPVLNGHCVDGNRTRVTITSTVDHANRTVWQIGGQIAEVGVELDEPDLIQRARRELTDVIPGLDLTNSEWSTYRVDRAEARAHGARPDDAFAQRDGDTITAWPTKLALAPTLVEQIMTMLDPPSRNAIAYDAGRTWPRPTVAIPPWETSTPWFPVD
ncbi:MAG: hypothetical protein KC983_07640, partial [Phycisphaerales bacterium]|nr:hypothetical protein [Phycisphaerales bacterium]